MARYFVYVLARSDKPPLPGWPYEGCPFYVGKGQRQRIANHAQQARHGHHCPKCNVIRKLWRKNQDFTSYIVFETDDEQAAFAEERRLIAFYGRDNLTNQTDGGDGISNPSAETRAKMRARKLGTKASLPTIIKMRVAGKRRYADPAERARQSKIAKEVVARPDVRERLGGHSKRRWADPDYRKRVLESLGRAARDPEVRARREAGVRAAYLDPTLRARVAAVNRARSKQPAYRESRRKEMKARWADPEYRLKQTAINRRIAADPDLLQRRNAAIRAAWTDERKASQGRLQKARSQDPNVRERLLATLQSPETKASRRAATQTQEFRDHQGELMKARWADPKYRAKSAESAKARMKAAWADPEQRAKRIASLKAAAARRKKP